MKTCSLSSKTCRESVHRKENIFLAYRESSFRQHDESMQIFKPIGAFIPLQTWLVSGVDDDDDDNHDPGICLDS